MVSSQIYLNKNCDTKIYQINNIEDINNAEKLIEKPGFIILDNYKWQTDLTYFRKYQLDIKYDKSEYYKHHLYDEEFQEIRKKLKQEIRNLYCTLFPKYKFNDQTHYSFRPYVSCNESMHFDTRTNKDLFLTSYINLDILPRIYQLSYTFPYLAKKHPKYIRPLKKIHIGNQIRQDILTNKGPLHFGAPKHTLLLNYGTIWFFDPHLISHQVIFGRMAMGYMLEVSNSSNLRPQHIIKDLQDAKLNK